MLYEKHSRICLSLSRTVGKRTGLYPDRKRGPWTFLFRHLRLVLSFSFWEEIDEQSIRSLLSFSISSLVSLAFFSLSLFLGKPSLWRGVPSFSFVRLIPRGSKKEADGRDRWHPVPLFRGKLVEEVAFKIPSPVLVPSVLFPPFEPPLPLKL